MRIERRSFILAASSAATLAACGEAGTQASGTASGIAEKDGLASTKVAAGTDSAGVIAKGGSGQGGGREDGEHDGGEHDGDGHDGDGGDRHHGDRDPHGRRVQKIIIDSDYNTMSDDGQAGVMAVQLQAQGLVKVLGITVVSGNKWLRQGVAEALKAVERLGVEHQIPVYAGANYALNHDYAMVQQELANGAGGDGYLGAWSTPEPKTDADLVPPFDGFATHTQVQSQSAVDFLIESIKANPHQITILALGPLTNIALATRKAPEIVPLIRKIIYMGGAVHVAGNTTNVAEFNWWFDPDAAREVLRLPLRHIVVPLDVTDTVLMNRALYDRVAFPPNPTAVTAAFRHEWFSPLFESDPNHTSNIWDTLTVAMLIDRSYATEVTREYLDIVVNPGGADNGQSKGYRRRSRGEDGGKLQKAWIVRRFDNDRFDEWYVDLLTGPVPVTLPTSRRDTPAKRMLAQQRQPYRHRDYGSLAA